MEFRIQNMPSVNNLVLKTRINTYLINEVLIFVISSDIELWAETKQEKYIILNFKSFEEKVILFYRRKLHEMFKN